MIPLLLGLLGLILELCTTRSDFYQKHSKSVTDRIEDFRSPLLPGLLVHAVTHVQSIHGVIDQSHTKQPYECGDTSTEDRGGECVLRSSKGVSHKQIRCQRER